MAKWVVKLIELKNSNVVLHEYDDYFVAKSAYDQVCKTEDRDNAYARIKLCHENGTTFAQAYVSS